ncbi:hypothetical protein [Iningainema tapete]|uniref:Uncharacterized protein n=1 Tax=Iningainema tapete BLCC-T55 TaxID=2748662 RepID=A0A8J6XI77_9CYAN|nr:hypothetical protein [Iningainema tapete]MBD2774893.1 hypothetical protein [Iningainema tapete BLCC-T55]
MVKEKQIEPQERLEKFIQHLQEARQLQRDWMTYGLDCVNLYVDDVDGDWVEKWGEDEKTVLESVTSFLESGDWVAVKVRKHLKNKSLQEIAVDLEKCLSLSEEENRIFAVKNVLVSNDGDYRDSTDKIDLLDLAESLLEKLTDVLDETQDKVD